MSSEFPSFNDNDVNLLKKIANNTALLADGGGGGSVTQLVAGTGITLSPVGGTGAVTITAAGAGVSSVAGTANEITSSPTTGAVVLSLPTALTLTGKTITGGTFTGGTFSGSSITDSGLTAGRVTFAGTAGLLSDDADLTFSTDTLTFTKGITPTSLLVGNATAANLLSTLTVYDTSTTLPRGISNVQVSSATDSANFSGYKARGTPGALTTIVTADLLANLRAWGYDGTNYINSGSIRWTSEGTIAATRVPSKLELLVSTDATPSVLTTTASFSGKDGITLTAVGTNQSITLTPSGSGSTTTGNRVKVVYPGTTPAELAGDGGLANFVVSSNPTGSDGTQVTALFQRNTSSTNTLVSGAVLQATSTGTAASGLGARFRFDVTGSDGTIRTIGGLGAALENSTDTGRLIFQTANAGSVATMAVLTGAGKFIIGGSSDDGINGLQLTGSASLTGKILTYNNIATAGNGVVSVQGFTRATAQTAAITVGGGAVYTVGASDASFHISANVNVTTATAHSFTMTCAYTDEGNTARTLTLAFTQLAGATLISTITNVTGAGPYESIPFHIRCKSATTITFATVGTFTTVTYNVEGAVLKLS